MEARTAAAALQGSLKDPEKANRTFTVADAAAQSGLPLRDAELGLHALTSEYRGHLRVTEDGDLLFLFPTGFTKPWETKDKLDEALKKLGQGALGVARFVVRAWLMIAIIGYALAFLAIIIALTVAQNSGNNNSSSRRGGSPGGAFGIILFRLLADSLFWTFHPFSPLSYGYGGYGYGYGQQQAYGFGSQARRSPKDETPFYEKVNRFVFGPTPPPEEPRAAERAILAEIRAQKGRIGLADVMRVTGLPRDHADPMMARLMLDYDGDVEVSEDGGITYKFTELRKSAEEQGVTERRPPAIWARTEKLPPLTGNNEGANTLIALLNAFNLGMGAFVLANNLTIARLTQLVTAPPHPYAPIIPIPYDGVPIVLGLIPLVFSAALFLFPLVRALLRGKRKKEIADENGRRSLLREILTRIEAHEPIAEATLEKAWTQGAGSPPNSKELTRRIVELGGDVEILENGETRYRFVDLETEEKALEEEREAAAESEAKIGRVVFGSDLN